LLGFVLCAVLYGYLVDAHLCMCTQFFLLSHALGGLEAELTTWRQHCYRFDFLMCWRGLQARRLPALGKAALTALLEQYLLGLVCPSERVQRANQAAVAREASLALQGAVRVMHQHVSPAASSTVCAISAIMLPFTRRSAALSAVMYITTQHSYV
jgi:hypothetical protein